VATTRSDDPFAALYDRDDPAYGLEPSPELEAYLRQCPPPTGGPGGRPRALDLGAGAGRDTLLLARLGMDVLAVDGSATGLRRLREQAAAEGLGSRVVAEAGDVRDVGRWARPGGYAAIAATTILDHLPPADLAAIWPPLVSSLAEAGVLYVEVHTREDPGAHTAASAPGPASESADQVEHHFGANELLRLAADRGPGGGDGLRVLRYEERREWDTTHGRPHRHGKAALLAVRGDARPAYYGHPAVHPPPSR